MRNDKAESKTWWDARRLNEESDMETVASSLGMQRDRSGSYKCPNPAHNDFHYGNCYLTRDRSGIVCYVCKNEKGRNKVWNPVSLLMECYGMKFPEACEYLANLTGCPERYTKNPPKQTNKSQKRYCLTAHEQELLGIDNGRTIYVPTESFTNRPEKEQMPLGWHVKEFSRDRGEETEFEYVAMKPSTVNFMDFAVVGSDFFKEIVRGKCIEQLAKCYMLITELQQPLTYPQYARMHVLIKDVGVQAPELINEYGQRINELLTIYAKFGGNPHESPEEIIRKYKAYA